MPKVSNRKYRFHNRLKQPYQFDENALKNLTAQQINENNDGFQLLASIQEMLHDDHSPSKRVLGTDMVKIYVTKNYWSQTKSSALETLIKSLGLLLLDRVESVRSGSIDALCHLYSLDDLIYRQMFNAGLLDQLIKLFCEYLIPIDFETLAQSSSLQNRKISSLSMFIDSFHLISSICDNVSEASIKICHDDQLKSVLLKCLNDFCFKTTNKKYGLEHLNLLTSTVEFLVVICDSNFLTKNPEIKEKLDQVCSRIFEFSYPLNNDSDESWKVFHTGQIYLKILLMTILFNCSLNDSVLFKTQLQSTLIEINSFPIILTAQKLVQRTIENELSFELNFMAETNPIYQEWRFYLMAKKYCFELFVSLIPDDENDLVTNFIFQNIKIFSDEFIENQINLAASLMYDESKSQKFLSHPFGQDIYKLVLSSQIAFFNFFACSLNFLNLGKTNEIWLLLKNCLRKSEETLFNEKQQRFDYQQELINAIRAFVLHFEKFDFLLSAEELDILLIKLNSSDSMISFITRTNSIKIISRFLCMMIEKSIEFESILQVFNSLLNSNFILKSNFSNVTYPEDVILLNGEILDSLIDCLADENFARFVVVRSNGQIVAQLTNLFQIMELQCKNLTDKYPVLETVIDNSSAFLAYLKKLVN